MEANRVTTMEISAEQHGANMVIRFHAGENLTSTPAEKQAMEIITDAIAKHLADANGNATIVRNDPGLPPDELLGFGER